jgi:hypothetical protein
MTMWNKQNFAEFQAALKTFLGEAKGVSDDELIEKLVNFVDQHCGPIEREYAASDFRDHLVADRDSIAGCVTEWAEELQAGIRWPVAYTYIVTGKLSIDYCQNTTVVVVAVDRDDNVLGQNVVHWSDFAHIEADKERYIAFHEAIDDCAISLGARSIFAFHCAARLTKSVSVAHHPEQGATLFHERSYRSLQDAVAETDQPLADKPLDAVSSDKHEPDNEFIKQLENL